jgi:L-aspartate oxidase
MDDHVSLRRSANGLRTAIDRLQAVAAGIDAEDGPLSRPRMELRSAAQVAMLVARAALANERSVGCHYRVDAPGADVPSVPDEAA